MNSGMETVSISTKSALPNSRLSCSAMAPAQVGALGPGAGGGGARHAREGSSRREVAAAPERSGAGAALDGRGRRLPLLPRGLRGVWGPWWRDGDGGGWSRL